MKEILIVSNPYEESVNCVSFYLKEDGFCYEITEGKIAYNRYTKKIFSINVAEIVNQLAKSFCTSTEGISIEYEGTEDDFTSLNDYCNSPIFKDFCKKENLCSEIIVKKSDKSLLNARDVFPEIKKIFESDIKTIVDEMKDDESLMDLLKSYNEVTQEDIPICLVGNYSTGKSSFINALIGYEVLPSSDKKMTSRIHKISASQQEDTATISFDYNSGIAVTTVEIIIREGTESIVTGLNSDDPLYIFIKKAVDQKKTTEEKKADDASDYYSIYKRISELLPKINSAKDEEIDSLKDNISIIINISVPFNKNGVLGVTGKKYTIIDTPGSNSDVEGSDEQGVLKQSMESLSNGLPIYIAKNDQFQSQDNTKLCEDILSMPELDSRFTMIVINCADSITCDELKSKNDEDIKDFPVPRKLYSTGVYYTSSVMGLGSKNLDAKGKPCFENKSYYEIWRKNILDFKDDSEEDCYKELYRYNIMPEYSKILSNCESAVLSQANCESAVLSQAKKVYANSGLYCIEKEIERFAEKYSAYNKCRQAKIFIDKSLDRAENYLNKKLAQLEDKEKQMEAEITNQNEFVIASLDTDCKNAQEESSNSYKELLNIDYNHAVELIPNFDTIRNNLLAIDEENKEKHNDELGTEQILRDHEEKNSILNDNLHKEVNVSQLPSALKSLFVSVTDTIRTYKNYSDTNKLSGQRASEDTINYANNEYIECHKKCIKLITDSSDAFWIRASMNTKDKIMKTVSGTQLLDDAKREKLRQYIFDYNIPDFSEKSNIFTATKYKNLFDVRLNIDSLASDFSVKMKLELSDDIRKLEQYYRKEFNEWVQILVKNIKDCIPDLNEKILRLNSEVSVLRIEKTRAEYNRDMLKTSSDKIAEKLSWHTTET